MTQADHADTDALRRALDYPYAGHAEDFLFHNGAAVPVPPGSLPRNGRVPVLAYGSNRAPAQLARKFTGESTAVAVEQVRAHGWDVVFCARFSSYGTLPAMLLAMPRTSVAVAVTWLTPDQLAAMDDTEGVTIGHYRRITLPPGTVTDRAGAPVADVQVYESDHPALSIGGAPVAFSAIPAEGRTIASMTAEDVLSHAHGHLSPGLARDTAILRVIADAAHRRRMDARLRDGLPPR